MKDRLAQIFKLSDGRDLGFAEYGDQNGFPVVYFHGSQSSRLEMHYKLDFANEHQLRIITVDRPGHGLSDYCSEHSLLHFSADLNQLLDQLGIETCSVVGMSAGAPFALAYAYSFPEKVKAVSIVSGFIPFTKESKSHLKKEVKVMLNLANKFPFLLRLMLGIQAKQLKKDPRNAVLKFLKIMSDPDQALLKDERVITTIEKMFVEAFSKGYTGVLHEISKVLVKEWGFSLEKINTPVYVSQGKKDNNVPFQWAEILNERLPQSKLNLFEGKGHLLIFEHAEEIISPLK